MEKRRECSPLVQRRRPLSESTAIHPPETTGTSDYPTYTLTSKVLGRGGHGVVKMGYCDQTLQKVAVKILQKSKLNTNGYAAWAQLENERKIMKHIRTMDGDTDNFVHLLDIIHTKEEVHWVMNLVRGKELFDTCYENSPGGIELKRAKRISRAFFRSVAALHSYAVVHLDLKLENIMLSVDDHPTIVDFGLSRMHIDKRGAPVMQRSVCGSPYYIPPEVLLMHEYDGKKADVWSCGIILYMMLTGCVPFPCDDETASECDENLEIFSRILDNDPVYPPYMDSSSIELVRWMLTKDPVVRPSMATVLNHSWFSTRTWKRGYITRRNRCQTR